ncbi:MAG: thiamine monophosphate kinase [Osedax symbiont Rs1]|nr:MAG: thiamine monophosphate kinase [Osedax symbiont Rs1]
MMDEFALIKRYFEQPNFQAAQRNHAIVKGIGDDCAILQIPDATELVFSIDTLVEGVHFLRGASAANIAWRLLGSAVSDLAAMGAEPNSFTLALTLPELSADWLQEFSENLSAAAAAYQLSLVGGDTTRGPLTLTVQVQGFVAKGAALLRSGASVGDVICVSGSLGDSRAGLSLLGSDIANPEHDYLRTRYYRPSPRIATGLLIKDSASACIDVSDGFLADLQHILTQSKVAAQLDAALIPRSLALQQVAGELALEWALNGGEDFELCFTVPLKDWPSLQKRLQNHNVAVTAVGTITAGNGLQLMRDGQWRDISAAGYKHF